MNNSAEQKLVDAIRNVEKTEHDMEDQVEALKHDEEVLDAPDALSQSLKDGKIVRDHLRASHLGD